jgi:hypothetical protein
MPGEKTTILAKPSMAALRALRAFASSTLLLLAPVAVFAANTTTPPTLAGIYVARVAKTAPSMTVSLGEDGTATVTGDLGKGSITSFGSWEGNGTQVKVTFNAEEGAPTTPPMIFQPVHHGLQAVSWDKNEWGNAQPPTMTKGYKVKYLFWSKDVR